ncbi:hypothetical protein L1987_57727 [Smallanthus sonchifolius]|uniref:Uncharacterized protein n=1 Tax=Smallanthus sonchifolius TaxID=185202 RepID=A0ACB9DDA6_9ASTR|nr:hypothetical protein L1987_57727 [Smallanthus sonchifolius]
MPIEDSCNASGEEESGGEEESSGEQLSGDDGVGKAEKRNRAMSAGLPEQQRSFEERRARVSLPYTTTSLGLPEQHR